MSAALLTRHLHTADPDLARVVEAWPCLPQHIRAAILSLLQSVGPPRP
jgi:hypothetical protein